MRRTPRSHAQTLRSLLLGAALVPTTLLGLGTLTGCRDENDPMTYVAELSDPGKQPAALKRLVQFYEDAMTKDKKDRNGPNVKPLLDKIVEPLAKVCVEANLQARTRSTLIKFLSDARDAKAEPCLKKTLADYKPDTTEEDVQNVMRAVAAMKLKSLSPEVMKVFTTMQISKPKANLIQKDVKAAVVAIADKAQEADFIKLLERPIADVKERQAVLDEAYWQIISAIALGEMKSEAAVEPLLKVVLTPAKADVRNTALVALVKIGQPAVGPVEGLLKGDAAELIKLSTEEQLKVVEKDKDGKIPDAAKKAAEKAHIATAAEVLGSLGSESSVAPLVSAIDKADDATKVTIALVLPLLPRSPATVDAFKKIFDGAKMDLEVPGVGRAKELLIDGSPDFFDASLVPWVVKSAQDAKGEQADVDALRGLALQAAMKAMKADQLAEVEALANTKAQGTGSDGKPQESTVGKAFEKEFKLAKELVTNCKDNVDCYVAKLTDEASQSKDGQFAGIKAGYMIAILGDPSVRSKIVDAIPKIDNGAVRFSALKALQALSPQGDADSAGKLLALLDKAEEAKDDKLVQEYQVFTQVAARLRARVK